MPLVAALCLAVIAGLAAAFTARVELRVSPKPVMLTSPFAVVGLFLALVLVPASAYFYMFYGDWFVLYFWDSAAIPSALALLGFIAQWCLGALAFHVGGMLVRSQRESLVLGLLIVFALIAIVPFFFFLERLQWVGSYVQFSRNFGLVSFTRASLSQGVFALGVLVVTGFATMLVRVGAQTGSRR